MAADLAPFVDAELAVMDVLEAIAPAVAWTGTDLADALPQIQVRRVGGDDDGTTDRARVVVSVFAGRAAQARELAEAARQRLVSHAHATPSGVIDKVRTEVGPQPVPTSDPAAVRRRDAIYRVFLRRRT
jgi:hypothetical protein